RRGLDARALQELRPALDRFRRLPLPSVRLDRRRVRDGSGVPPRARPPPHRGGARERRARARAPVPLPRTMKPRPLAIASAGAFVAALSTSLVAVSAPVIAKDLSATPADVSWVLSAYLLAITCLLALAGRAADLL